MLTYRFDNPSVVRGALSDFERLESGTLDTNALLAGAPILSKYTVVLGWSHALKGVVEGHPSVLDGREIVTSQLIYLDPKFGLARTLSRWYRVTEPQLRRGS